MTTNDWNSFSLNFKFDQNLILIGICSSILNDDVESIGYWTKQIKWAYKLGVLNCEDLLVLFYSLFTNSTSENPLHKIYQTILNLKINKNQQNLNFLKIFSLIKSQKQRQLNNKENIKTIYSTLKKLSK